MPLDARQDGNDTPLFGGWSRGWWCWRPVDWLPEPSPGWGWPQAIPWCPPPVSRKPAWTVFVQCRDASWSANTLLPDWCWWGRQVPTCHVVPGLRNGVPCRCFCPPGRCEGKRGVSRRFRPW